MAKIATWVCWGVVVVTWIAGAAYGVRKSRSHRQGGPGGEAGLGASLALLVVGVVFLAGRIPIEERLMSKTFPDEYASYRERVPRLVPGLQLLRRVHGRA